MILNEGTRVVVGDDDRVGMVQSVISDDLIIVKFDDTGECVKVESSDIDLLCDQEIPRPVYITEEEFKGIVAEKAEIAADGNDVMSICLRLFGASIGAAIFGKREP